MAFGPKFQVGIVGLAMSAIIGHVLLTNTEDTKASVTDAVEISGHVVEAAKDETIDVGGQVFTTTTIGTAPAPVAGG